ncbi:aspartate aminotransferase family protein [Rhodotorula paludigena]|uniref:aspartate aminotransferase family protein n=1 Tax=Rhodotorula paludigena TaxID=86838 RepID=UPI0031815DB1
MLARSAQCARLARALPAAPVSRRSLASSPRAAAKACTDYLKPTHRDDEVPADVAQKLARHAAVTLNTYARPNYILARGKGCKVWDTHDREFLDFSGGIAVNALGHADEGVAKVLQDQSRKLVHNSNLWHNEWSGELAYLLVQKTKELGGLGYAAGQPEKNGTPDEGGLKVFFTNSGTESNEGALKFVRKYGKHVAAVRNAAGAEKGVEAPTDEKVEIVSFRDGFHGRSMGALSATWQDKYQAPFSPLVPGFVPATLNDIDSINQAVTERTCGVILEPIQGEGGILEANEDFLRALRRRCDEVGALLVFDEIQCGLGRTGSLWAHGSLPTDCHPDIVTMAKPLANGLPVGAIMMKDKVADVIKLGDHGTTFGGQPLQTRVAHHVVSRLATPSFLSHVSSVGSYLHSRLSALHTLFPRLVAGAPRGRGLILGVPFTRDEYVQRIVKLMRERGVLVLSCGKATVRFVPSLTVSEEEAEKCVDVLESALLTLDREVEGI